MSNLKYVPIKNRIKNPYESQIYEVPSLYTHKDLRLPFIQLKGNLVDLNPAFITKCIQGTEQDFLAFMNKAKNYIERSNFKINQEGKDLLLEMLSDCVFGYYVITPLIKDECVSDIKILAWNKIVCKVKGDRYTTKLSFESEEDFNKWYERIIRIQKLKRVADAALQHCSDRKGVDDSYLRLDLQLNVIVSDENNNIHIRKMPKAKYSWQYLKDANMLDDEILEYLQNRIVNGYSFIISGRGGSGKSSLLNNMVDLVPYNESILVAQESDELYSETHPQFQAEHTLDVFHDDGSCTTFELEDILRLGLLQDIDNFMIGEVKGGEALHCFTTGMSTGARYFLTIHSNDARGSVVRLAQCARYISDYSMETLLSMIPTQPVTLIHLSHFSIDEILEVDSWDSKENRLLFKQVYKKGI